MGRETHPQTNFTGGEWSPRADARIDIDKYNNSASRIENFLINQVGGAFFRPGTYFSNTAKNSSAGKICLIPFVYSTSQAYVLEAGDKYFYFYANGGRVINAGNPVSVTTPYAIADVFSLRGAQNGDVKYFVSSLGTYQQQKLIRLSATQFALVPVITIGGPFQSTNISTTTVTASSDTGSTNLTVTIPAWGAGNQYTQGAWVTNSGTTYTCVLPNTSGTSFTVDLNSGYWKVAAFFQSGHAGSLFAIGASSAALGTVVITTYNSPTSVSGYVQNLPSGAAGNLATSGSAQTSWAFGAFSTVSGWPTSCVFYEQRFYYGMGNTFYGSTIGAFDDYSAGTELTSDAVDYELLEELLNNIGWLAGSTFAMKAGTSDGSFYISSGTQNLPISPSNILAQKQTTWPSSVISPARLYDAIYYASSDINQIRELRWYLDIEADRSVDMTLMADHILMDGGGAVMIDDQSYPQGRIWVPRNDGQIAVLTRNIEQEVQGWCRIIMGNTSGGPGIVESEAIIPTAAGSSQIWVSVLRVINGTPTRCIEYFTPETFINAWDPVRMDCALTYNVPVTITGITKSPYCLVTAPGHGFTDGMQVKVDNVLGMTQLNNGFYLITNPTINNFTITDSSGNPINSSGFTAYQSGGQVRKMVTSISGLDYLDGENVVVSCDGGLPGKQQVFTVSAGSITLPQPAAVVNVGLPYTGIIQLQKFSGTAQGKMTRIYLATMRVVKSLGLKVGTDLTKMSAYKFAIPNNPVGPPPSLFTDDLEITWQTGWSKTDQVYLVQDVPLPLFICGGFFRSESEELN